VSNEGIGQNSSPPFGLRSYLGISSKTSIAGVPFFDNVAGVVGILRFVLASAVVCAHSKPIPGLGLLPASEAVQAFFIISGFYMTLILDSKYERKGNARWLFYSNRFLRIFPMYYATLLLCVVIYGAAAVWTGRPVDRLAYWMQAAQHGDWPQLALLALAQVSIIGIEFSSFFAFSAQHGFAVNAGLPGTVEGWRFCFLPQAWTIGIELVFYALAPWLIHLRKRVLLILVLANLAALILVTQFWDNFLTEILIYHFFPFNLGYFLLGILAYRLFYKRPVPGLGSEWFNWLVVGLIAAACGTLGLIHPGMGFNCARAGFIGLLFLGVTFLFQRTKYSVADRLIGELSYPIYLCHLPMKWAVLAVLGHSSREAHEVPIFVLLPLAVVLAALMVRWIDYPVDRYRQQRASGAKAAAFPHGDAARGGKRPKLN